MVDNLLTELYDLLHDNAKTSDLIRSHRITELITELLDTFGLPQHQEYIDILSDFYKTEPLSNELIDITLIRLADEGAYQRTLSKLTQ